MFLNFTMFGDGTYVGTNLPMARGDVSIALSSIISIHDVSTESAPASVITTTDGQKHHVIGSRVGLLQGIAAALHQVQTRRALMAG